MSVSYWQNISILFMYLYKFSMHSFLEYCYKIVFVGNAQPILSPRTSRRHPPPTSPGGILKVLFDHPRDVPNWRPGDLLIWRPGDVSKWCPWDALIWRSRDVPGRLIRDVPRTFSGRPLDDLGNMSYGRCGFISWMSLNLFLLFLRNLFDWPNLSQSNSILKVHLEPSRTSKIELFVWN